MMILILILIRIGMDTLITLYHGDGATVLASRASSVSPSLTLLLRSLPTITLLFLRDNMSDRETVLINHHNLLCFNLFFSTHLLDHASRIQPDPAQLDHL